MENIEKIHTFAMRHSNPKDAPSSSPHKKNKVSTEGKAILSAEDLKKLEDKQKEEEKAAQDVEDPLREIYKKSYYIEDEPEAL